MSLIYVVLQLCDDKGTRVIVTGVPGSGKTTFVKYLCYEWARAVLKEDASKVLECDKLTEYLVVLPIKVRLVKNETSIEEILKKQLQLENIDVEVIFRALERDDSAAKVLFIFDGWDESGLVRALQPLLEKRMYPETKIITTTRPHGVGNFRRITRKWEDQKAEIWGFTPEQMDDYIRRFFGDKYPEEGVPLLSYLETHQDLLGMAKIPLNLEMMCQVWNKKKNLGNHLVDIYEEFVKCKFEHCKKKPEWLDEQVKGVSPEQKYEEIIKVLGNLATIWNSKGTFDSIFSEEILEECLGCNHKIIVDLGYIMSEGEDDRWVFNHATMQDYFAAYHFAKFADDECTERLVESCLSLGNLVQHKNMIRFLCGLRPLKANSVLQKIIKKYEKPEECELLLKYIIDFIKVYKNLEDQNLPLPKHVDVNIDTNVPFLLNLFDSDCDEHKNLKHITFRKFPKTDSFPGLRYIESFTVNMCNICSSQELETGAISVFAMNSLSSVSFVISRCEKCLDTEETSSPEREKDKILPAKSVLKKYLTESKLSCKKVHEVNFEGKAITDAIPYIMENIRKRNKTLQILRVVEHDPEIKNDVIGKLCNTAVSNKLLELHMEIERLQSSVHKIQDVNLFLTVRAATNEDLRTFVNTISSEESPCFLKELTLIGLQSYAEHTACNKASTDAQNIQPECPNSGRYLADVLYLFPKLDKFKLEDCEITKDTLDVINESIVKNYKESASPVKELNFFSGDFSEAGNSLGDLITHINPDSLSVCDSKLSGVELQQLGTNLPEYPEYASLRKLHLENNTFAEGFDKMAEVLYKLPHLEVLAIIGCCINKKAMKDLNEILEDYKEDDDMGKKELMTKIRILDMGYNELSKGALGQLGHFAKTFLPELQALCLPCCKSEDVNDLTKLITCLPKKVEYLDVSKNLYGGKITELTASQRENVQDKLCQLNKLNIGQRDNDSERAEIRTRLVKLHKDMNIDGNTEVYYANKEDVCQMYFF